MTTTQHTGVEPGTRSFDQAMADADALALGVSPLEDDQQLAALVTADDQGEDQGEAAPFDPLDALTIAELDAGSRLLKASVVAAIAEKNEHYEKALAVVAYLHARRSDRTTAPAELLAGYTRLSYSELSEALASFAPPPDPTTPRRG